MPQRKKRDCFVGVDLGGTNIQAGVMGPDHKLRSRIKLKTQAERGPGHVVGRVIQAVHDCVEEAGAAGERVGGVCVGAPGVTDPNRGVVLTAVNLRWNNYPLARVLTRSLSVPAMIDNDVNVGTWGEYVEGAGKGGRYEDALGVFVGTGIGGGLVINHRLYHGHAFTAGEIGHVLLHADAPLGRRTLENLASRTAIVNLLTQLIQSNHPSEITRITGGDLTAIRSKVLAQAVRDNDPLTVRVVRHAARCVGVAIANVVTLMSLPLVIVGGGVTEALGKTYVDWVREGFEEAVFPLDLRRCKLVAGRLGDDAGVIGAALLAQERFG